MNLSRILTIAIHVFWEVLRERVLYIVGFFLIVFPSAILLLKEFSVGTEKKIILDFGIALIGLLGLVVAVFVGTGLINKEIEKRTVLVTISKPVSRSEFIIGKHLGLSAVLALLVTLMTVIYLVILSLYQVKYPIGSILVAALYLFFELSLLAAVAILFGVFTSSLLATSLTISVYVMGHLSRDLLQLGDISKNPTIKNVTQGIYLVLPDLARLDLKNQAVYGILPPPTELLFNAGYGLLYIVLLLAIANLIFWRREF
ncbi:ABC transporter permease [Microcoleus sp. FACHB-672]|uniref:ABC transporter permease n=1 Tax=Microcoleus sp. FACHB-672 TaxID=2692825 RepID=UPI00168311A8|nr:ABC transporter permease subunit [Microcoleus sp. FACHB-672]MBD2040094.1 ABC transporter permease [Microcoleus sp. FACHB-672]